MEGIATWPQLLFICSVIVGVFLLAWRIQEVRSKDRHEHRSVFEQNVASLKDYVDIVKAGLEKQAEARETELQRRLHSLEMANAGTLVVLKHMEDFRAEVSRKFDEMTRKRSEDMANIHR